MLEVYRRRRRSRRSNSERFSLDPPTATGNAARSLAFASLTTDFGAGHGTSNPEEIGPRIGVLGARWIGWRGAGAQIRFAFVGDIHFEGMLRRLLDDHARLLNIRSYFWDADLVMGNLETAVTQRGKPEKKQFTFRAPPRVFRALHEAGITVVSMANNHGLDYGRQAASKMRCVRHIVGAFPSSGSRSTPRKPTRPTARRFANSASRSSVQTQVLDGNLIRTWTAHGTHGGLASAKNPAPLLAAVRAARLSSDTIGVYIHLGRELEPCPLAASDAARGRTCQRRSGHHRRRPRAHSAPDTLRRTHPRRLRSRKLHLFIRTGGTARPNREFFTSTRPVAKSMNFGGTHTTSATASPNPTLDGRVLALRRCR